MCNPNGTDLQRSIFQRVAATVKRTAAKSTEPAPGALEAGAAGGNLAQSRALQQLNTKQLRVRQTQLNAN